MAVSEPKSTSYCYLFFYTYPWQTYGFENGYSRLNGDDCWGRAKEIGLEKGYGEPTTVLEHETIVRSVT